jgi:hypothetical protein
MASHDNVFAVFRCAFPNQLHQDGEGIACEHDEYDKA